MSADDVSPRLRLTRLCERADGLAAVVRVVRQVHRSRPGVVSLDDLLQSTVARGLAAADGFRGTTDAELLAWLRTVANNYLADEARKPGTRTNRADIPDDLAAGGPTPERAVETRETVAQLLSRVSPLEAAILQARHQAGLSLKQIAAVLEQSPAAIRQTHHRLVQRLRRGDVT